jgi:small-conductance mechanosensitive channel
MANGLIGNVSPQDFILFILVVVLTFLLGGVLNVLIIRLLKERVKRPFVYKSLSKFVMYSVYATGLYLAFSRIIHFNLPAGLAALGILGLAVFFPLVPILQNIAAGILLALEGQYKEGDIVDVNGELCKVDNVMLRKTRFRSLSGRIISMPNLVFITAIPVINYTRGEFIMVRAEFKVPPESDIDKISGIIEKACSDSPNILPNIPEKKLNRLTKLFEIPRNFLNIPKNIKNLSPQLYIKQISKDKITLEARFWIWDMALRDRILSFFYKRVLDSFEKEKIKLAAST